MGALELSNAYQELEKRFGDQIKIYGISPNENSLDEFRKLNIFKYPILIPKRPQLLRSVFKFESPGLLKCFGFCNKSVFSRFQKARNLKLGFDFKGKYSALGGIVILNNKGKIFYSYKDKYLGDRNYLDEIEIAFTGILSKKFNLGSKALSSRLDIMKISIPEEDSQNSSFKSSKESNGIIMNEVKSTIGDTIQAVKPDEYLEMSSINISKLQRIRNAVSLSIS